VTLPVLSGPGLPGLPADEKGFIPVDDHGLVQGLADVYAAGDATTFPIKQGGIATQQADAVARAVAARAGAPVSTDRVRPVLRGMLLTGSAEQYLRLAIAGGAGEGEAAMRALWWPPHKVAGHYLAPYLFGRQEEEILEGPDDAHVPVAMSLPAGLQAGGIELLAAGPARQRP
jgi:sulfide:quinone oxidoreductase